MSGDGESGWRTGTRLACGHEVHDPNQVHYCAYISLAALESLARPFATDPARSRDPYAFDETLFVVVHQVSELAFGQAADSLAAAIDLLDGDPADEPFRRGLTFVRRATYWIRCADDCFAVLRTMEQFASFRARLAPASGAESVNVRRFELFAALREDSPYVTERGQAYTYRGFLDRAPGPSENEPKTRWWTEAMDGPAAGPTLWDRLNTQLARHSLTLEDVVRTNRERERPHEAPQDPSVHMRLLCEALAELEEAYVRWRQNHRGVTVREVGILPGTGHTSGLPYLKSVSKTVRLFPGLRDLFQASSVDAPGGDAATRPAP